jgi:SAM-dependent MidA family methyltransferase
MQPWSLAMAEALYGPSGFYRLNSPGEHFRTSVTSSPLFAAPLARLVELVDIELGHPATVDVVDVGAGDGSLLALLVERLPDELARRVEPLAVEIRARPEGLGQHIRWSSDLPPHITGVVMAHELLDNVPCDVAEQVDGELRVLVVDEEGRERPGDLPPVAQQQWLSEWWPLDSDGDRAECGGDRDRTWASIVHALGRGVALAVDYGHVLAERSDRRFPFGTLTGYRDGHQVVPVPDGTCDLTAHVAIDACTAAGAAAGAEHSVLLRQRAALRQLGVRGELPPRELAESDPARYVRQLSEASSAAELLDPGALGSFWWLLQSKGMPLPVGSEALSD